MQRKTLTTLNQLRKGDVFVFLKKDQPWRVTGRTDNNRQVTINQFINGNPIYKYDEMKSGSMQIIFMRHTIPLPGEECYVEDLQPGDVLHKTDDIINEYEVKERGDIWSTLRCLQSDKAEMAGKHLTVVFIKHRGQ